MRRELPPYPPPPVMVLRKISFVLRTNLTNLLIIGLTVCCFPLAELYQLLTFFLILLDQLVSRATPSPRLLPVFLSSPQSRLLHGLGGPSGCCPILHQGLFWWLSAPDIPVSKYFECHPFLGCQRSEYSHQLCKHFSGYWTILFVERSINIDKNLNRPFILSTSLI